ncbi:MAG: glycine cleavage system protein GcvH [Gammaproteobacteria bacterium]
MSTIPQNAKYSTTHEWVRLENDGTVTIGITDHAQHALGDMVFIDPPKVGSQITAKKECGVVESVKSASDVYSPISGEVVAINEAVVNTPALLNQDPHGEAWICRVKPSNNAEMDALMDAAAYEKFLETESH